MNYPSNSNLTLDATRHLSSYTPTHFQQQQQYNSNNTMLQRPQTPLYSAAAASTMDIRSTLSPSTGYYLSPSAAALANNQQQQQQLPTTSWGVSSLSPSPFSRNSMTNRIPGLTTTAMAASATSLSPTTHHQLMKPLATTTTATSPMMGFMVGPISPSATATIAPTAVAPDSAFKLSKFLQRSASKQSPSMTTMMPQQQQQQLQSQAQQQQQQYSFSFSSPAPTMTTAAATTATTTAAETKDTPPPTESITDLLTLNAPITLDSGSSSKPSSAAAAVSKQYWVRIFGFPSSKISIVLSDFSALCGGRILNHVSSEGNWVDVAFDSESARMKALERNGQMLDSLKHFVIGVLKLSDDVHGSSAHVDNSSSSDERAVPKRLYMIKRPNDIVMSDERGEQTLKRKRSMYDDEPTTEITASSSSLLTTMADERPLKRQRSFFYQMLENIFKF